MRQIAIASLLFLSSACAIFQKQPHPPMVDGTVVAPLTSTAPPLPPMRAYGEVFAEDFGAAGFDPPPGKYSYWPNPKPYVDNGPALQAAIDAVPFAGLLRFRSCRYYSAQTLYVRHDMRIVMLSGTRVSPAYCGLIFAPGIAGLVLDAPTTLTGVSVMSVGRTIPVSGPITTAHGIVMHQASWLDGVGVQYFEGDGVHIECSNTDTPSHNCNLWRMTGGLLANNVGRGLSIRGADTNDGLAENISAISNGLQSGAHNGNFNYDDNSFLGNTFLGCHSDANPNAYSAGYDRTGGGRVENRNNKSVFVNCYEEDGTNADLASNVAWLFGYGLAALVGQGPWLKVDGGGLQSHHFTAAPVPGTPSARLGSVGGGTVIGEWYTPKSKTPVYIYPTTSAARAGGIDISHAMGSSRVSLTVSTSSSADGAGFLEAPDGVRVGAAQIVSMAAVPATGKWKRGDLVLNAVAAVGQPWAWQCTVAGSPGTWRSLVNGGLGAAKPPKNP